MGLEKAAVHVSAAPAPRGSLLDRVAALEDGILERRILAAEKQLLGVGQQGGLVERVEGLEDAVRLPGEPAPHGSLLDRVAVLEDGIARAHEFIRRDARA